MKEQDAGLLKILGPLAGDALRLSGYDKNGVSVALNPVDAKMYEVRLYRSVVGALMLAYVARERCLESRRLQHPPKQKVVCARLWCFWRVVL